MQRDGIERLRHAMRYSRQHSTICNTLVDAGWVAGVGAKVGPDPREMGESDLVIVWGSNPAATQVNVMTHIARLNTTFTETPTSRKREQRPTALIHPGDCEQLGIASGDRVKIGNQRGEIVVHAKAFDGLQRGVLVVESIWPNSDFATGVDVNALIGADPGPPNGGAVFHDSAVWVKRAP